MTVNLHLCRRPGHKHFNPAHGHGEKDIRGGCTYCLWLLKVWQTVQGMVREERAA